MLLPLETGITWGQPRDAGGAGKPAPRAGVWPWRAVRSTADAGQPADVARRGRAGAPPSHTWRGPSSFLRPYARRGAAVAAPITRAPASSDPPCRPPPADPPTP